MRERAVTAIYGGSFDPIHTGHAIVASSTLRSGAADEVWFLVSPRNPLKPERQFAPDALRLKMAEAVADRMPGLAASGFEFGLPLPSYTYRTLRALRDRYPDRDFRLLIGSDNWLIFDRWKNAREILDEFGVIVFTRPDLPVPEGFRPEALSDPDSVTVLSDIPQSLLSSSHIRRLRGEKKPITFLVDPLVESIIIQNNLYSTSSDNETD